MAPIPVDDITALLAALKILLGVLAVWITVKGFEQSVGWGLFFLALPLLFGVLERVLGSVLAGALIIVAPLRFAHLQRSGVRRLVVATIAVVLVVTAINRATFGTWPWR